MKSCKVTLACESLEMRALMAGDLMHNFLLPHDVNDDRLVTPMDALRVINRLNQPDSGSQNSAFEDVNDDSWLTPIDALLVINDLNLQVSQDASQSQSSQLVGSTGAAARLELETNGGETELSVRIMGAPSGKAYSVSINDIALGSLLTDARGRGRLDLSLGDDSNDDLPIPAGLLPLSPDMELVIGDVVRGKLSDVLHLDHSSSSSSNSSGSSNSGDHSNSASTEFRANLPVVNSVQSSAEYEIETEGMTTKRKFKVELEHAKPGTEFQVKVGDQIVGSITADSKGRGKFVLSSHPKSANEILMPHSFPSITESTSVSIGDAMATFHHSV